MKGFLTVISTTNGIARMSSFLASNFITKLSFNLQPRLLLSPPRLNRSVVRCLSGKTNGPKVPVRCIPKKFRDVNQVESTSSGDKTPKDSIGASSGSSFSNGAPGHKAWDRLKHSQRSRLDHKELNVSFDDAHVHVVPQVNEDDKQVKRGVQTKPMKTRQEFVKYKNMPQKVVKESQSVKRDKGEGCEFLQQQMFDDECIDIEYMEPPKEDVEEMELYYGIGDGKEKRSNPSKTKQDAEKLAIESLATRAYTKVELWKKLTAKKFPVTVVNTVLSDFQNRGLINDRQYAEMFSHSKWKSSSWGPWRIKRELLKKGVSAADIEKAIKVVFEDGKDSERGSSMKLSNSSLQNLYTQVSKQWQRSQNVPHQTRKTRLIRWLQYRGFDWEVVSNMLKRLESDCPP